MASSSFVDAKDIEKSDASEYEEFKIDSHKSIPGFTQWIEEEDARYLAMEDVYNDKTKAGTTLLDGKWSIAKTFNDPKTGFKGKLYNEIGTNNYVFAAAGTQILSGRDWANNIAQQFKFETPQYNQARLLADELTQQYGNKNLVFIGHSLGGGLASTMSRLTGVDAITFNASALQVPLYKGPVTNSKIAAYITDGDILDYVNESLFGQKVEGQIIRRIAPSSKLPNLDGIPYSGIYQAIRGIKIHCDPNVI
jgi:hypothetical protein